MMMPQPMPQGNSMLSPSTNPPTIGGNLPMMQGMPITMPTESQIRAYMIQKYMGLPNYDKDTANSPPDVSVRGGILSRMMNPTKGGY